MYVSIFFSSRSTERISLVFGSDGNLLWKFSYESNFIIQSDEKVSVHLMIVIVRCTETF